MSYKRSFILILSVLLFGLAGSAVFNYYIDPAGIFRTRQYEAGIANIILSGKNAANVGNCDERLVQKYIVENSKTQLDVLVLGSSRTMQIHSYLFPQKKFFNNSVSSAALEDDIAIFGMYQNKKILPKKVIIGLDPWLLNKYNGRMDWQSIANDYKNACGYMGISYSSAKGKTLEQRMYKKYLELISLPYLQASYQNWKQRKTKQNSYYETTATDLPVSIKFADGALGYPAAQRNVTVEDAEAKAVKLAASKPIEFLGDFNEMDKDYQQEFEKFIAYLQSQDIDVVFFLPPYHPLVYNALQINPQYSVARETETYFRDFAKQHNISVLGSYNPAINGLSAVDFYDGMHIKTEAVDRIFKSGILTQ